MSVTERSETGADGSHPDYRPAGTSRRRFLRIIAAAGGGGLAAWGLGSLWWHRDDLTSLSRVLMGTVVHLTLAGDDRAAAETAAAACLGRMAELEAVLSRYRPDSQVSCLNRDGRLDQAGPALCELVQRSLQLSELTRGAFDITVEPVLQLYRQAHARHQGLPSAAAVTRALHLVDWRRLHGEGSRIWFESEGMAITLDGIAKGYIVDSGVAVLQDHGFDSVLVEAGGDLLAAGTRAVGQDWRIAIARPRASASGEVVRFQVRDRAVATSGDSMQPFSDDLRHHHIIDPGSGASSTALASATVIAPDTTLADGLATTLMVLAADDGLELVEQLAGCDAYLVTKAMDVLHTTGFPV
jgi:thiamine biosynthesis lipoprotein